MSMIREKIGDLKNIQVSVNVPVSPQAAARADYVQMGNNTQAIPTAEYAAQQSREWQVEYDREREKYIHDIERQWEKARKFADTYGMSKEKMERHLREKVHEDLRVQMSNALNATVSDPYYWARDRQELRRMFDEGIPKEESATPKESKRPMIYTEPEAKKAIGKMLDLVVTESSTWEVLLGRLADRFRAHEQERDELNRTQCRLRSEQDRANRAADSFGALDSKHRNLLAWRDAHIAELSLENKKLKEQLGK